VTGNSKDFVTVLTENGGSSTQAELENEMTFLLGKSLTWRYVRINT